jgi:hypothetical protein
MLLCMTTTTYDDRSTAARDDRGPLRRMLTGAAAFDGAMGVACLAAASPFGRWLAVGTAPIRVTGGVFLLAALAGVVTLRRSATDVRLIAGANLLFAAWCLVMIGADSPNAVGTVLLAGAAATSAATAYAELRLA